MKHCKNCGKPANDAFCSHCGQRTSTGRITYYFIIQEIFHFFTHMEKGFLFTSIQMILHPGVTVCNYLEGKRKTYQSPVSYFLIWITIFILTLLGIEKLFGGKVVIDYQEYFGPDSTTRFAISHLSLVLTAIIPFQSLYLYLLITKGRYNYFEAFVAVIYALGTVILFQFVFSIIGILYYAISSNGIGLRVSDIFKVVYLSWFTYDFTKRFAIRFRLLKGIIFLILSFGTFTLWRMYGFPALFG